MFSKFVKKEGMQALKRAQILFFRFCMQDINILVKQQVSLSQTVNSFKASGFPFSKRICPLFLHTPLIRLYKEVHEGNRIRGAFFLLNIKILR